MRTPATAPLGPPLIITGLVNTSDNLLFFTVIITIKNTVTIVMIIIILRYLTIIPRARMGYESIAREAEGRMGY